jgi:hypothetical protein
LRNAAKAQICNIMNGFEGPKCPIMTASTGFCGGSLAPDASRPGEATKGLQYSERHQAPALLLDAGTKETFLTVERTASLNPVTGIKLHRLAAATTGIDAMTISFASGDPETLGNADALALDPFASVNIPQNAKVGLRSCSHVLGGCNCTARVAETRSRPLGQRAAAQR